MTASAMASDRLLCLQAGMNDQVNKPIDVTELFATLQRWVRPGAFVSNATEKGPEEATETRFPDQIPGIDVPKALKRLGSAVLLRKLLLSFRQENLETTKNLHEALAQGDDQLVQRLIHTVKGVGSNLGATELTNSASLLEEAIKEGDTDAQSASWSIFEKNLSLLLNSIRAMEERGAKFAETKITGAASLLADRERIVLLLRELIILLDANNMTALAVWAKLKPLLGGSNIIQVDTAMSALNFKGAGKTLQKLVETLGVTL
jgi:HPt (histidine-containing phosphotransfer) domain-containing protein